MENIQCLLNGKSVTFSDQEPTTTLLYWLREQAGLSGTKEGCNEGDCGACTVLVSDIFEGQPRHRAMNACILFLPQLHLKSIRTVEGITDGGSLHPVQQEMINHHGSQCGFCTPGIVMSLVAAEAESSADSTDDVLAGNLCRCTGYAAIARAAAAASGGKTPAWISNDMLQIQLLMNDSTIYVARDGAFLPDSLDRLCQWYQGHPNAILVAGATDVGLWVTKQMRDLDDCAFLAHIPELNAITETRTDFVFGAAVTMNRFRAYIAPHFPDLAEMVRRFGSVQVRNAATLGGNIANGSPIGDAPPALIALGARIELRLGDVVREIALEDFFISYGKQDRAAGEVLTRIFIPKQTDNLRCYKISKRFDQDISALCGCFSVQVDDGQVTAARIAFGGMAGIPARARKSEQALLGKPWSAASVQAAQQALDEDYTPLSDMRASNDYRLLCAQNLLRRYYLETTMPDTPTRVLEVME